MKLDFIDNGKEFDFGKTSDDYAKFRDIYPKSMYDKLIMFGIGKQGQKILDLGSGTAILPVNMYHTGAEFTATDISENQIEYGRKIAKSRNLNKIQFKVCSAEDTKGNYKYYNHTIQPGGNNFTGWNKVGTTFFYDNTYDVNGNGLFLNNKSVDNT